MKEEHKAELEKLRHEVLGEKDYLKIEVPKYREELEIKEKNHSISKD